MSKNCPLCLRTEISLLPDSPAQMDFWGCSHCGLLFKDRSHHLSREAEKQRYMTHQNSLESKGYVDFLTPVVETLKELNVREGSEGLDFGCGPGPVLAQLLGAQGYCVNLYDPHFFPDLQVEPGSLDFLVCTESAEHFYQPAKEVDLMGRLLTPQAPVVWMTSLWRDEGSFADWYYIKDPSHVVIYTEKSIHWIGSKWKKKAHFRGKNLIWWT